MPVYTFRLRDGSHGIEDDTGIALPDRKRAFDYACEVVRELMCRREQQTRTWQLDVYEDGDERIFAIPFARLDETLGHLGPEMRERLVELCDRCRSIREAMSAVAITVRESRALVARSRGKPYLAAEFGQRTIR